MSMNYNIDLNIVKFEVLDEQDKLLATFYTPEEVEEFFNVLDEYQTEDYIIQAFDEYNRVVDTWYMPDVVSGNFKDDVEKTKKANKLPRKL